ncbi:unnamed protein product [Zymoseptoria tritici ST99CH_3D7]|uniref:Uncharacterized protein n=3 Tax=Zymoseptoria tritici TaxID=1047171 RepID=A0A1X7RC03_ZYMT9|nr:unnamed protein product [Zymoseptoria tritici ST99CH_3D7]SMR41256.1 unnamed protein product [Zymoseptoria tritici ST99CH_1E4]
MSVKGALNTLGAFGSALTIIGFGQSNIPTYEPAGTSVRIKAGRSTVDAEENDLGGQIGAVYGYNGDNEFIGQSTNALVREADEIDFIIDQDSPAEQAVYVSVSARNDAICASWIAVEYRDASSGGGGAWTGDVGRHCGQRWAWGREVAGKNPDGTDWEPACTWLDANFTNNTLSTSMKFKASDYGDLANQTLAEGRECDATIFAREGGPIAGKPQKRDLPPRPQSIADELVVSNLPGQTAEELCSSETSWGQDFVGVDGKYCDMETKTLYTLCSTEEVDDCVEMSSLLDADAGSEEPGAAMEVVKRTSVAKRSVTLPLKSYKKVDYND